MCTYTYRSFRNTKKGFRRKSIDLCKSVSQQFNIRNAINVWLELALLCLNNTAKIRKYELELTRFNCISKLLFNTKYEFWRLQRRIIFFTNNSYPCCLHGVWRWSNLWGVMIVASMYPASKIAVEPINCEYTSIWDNILLLRTLRYDFCKWSVLFEHRYVYTKRILNSTIIANIEVCFIQMQCAIEALICIFKTFWLYYKFLYCFKCLLILIKS